MNIFYLSNDVEECAMMHSDKHVVKMILEYAQILSTAHRVLDGKEYLENKRKKFRLEQNDTIIYQATHIKHPSVVWVYSALSHYQWLFQLFACLCREYTYRYTKIHLTEEKLLKILNSPPKNILNPTNAKFYPPPCAMPEECKCGSNTIASYQKYYAEKKMHFAKWTKRPVPAFISNILDQAI